MKLYVDLNDDRPYLVTDDGESVYEEDLQEDGRETSHLEQAIEEARLARKSPNRHAPEVLELSTNGLD